MPKSFWLKKAFKFLVAGTLFVAVVGYVTMSLWNNLMPYLFHLPLLSYWQALGLLLLSRLLLGGFGRGGRGGGWARGGWMRGRMWQRQMEQRMASFSPEEREKFRQRLQNRCAGNWGRPGAEVPMG